MSNGMKLNLGCGKDIRAGWVNIDQHEYPGVEIMDISNPPLAFEDNSVEEVLASHSFEHILHWEELIKDIHRFLRPGGRLEVRVPYMVCPEPYHFRTFGPDTLNMFIKDSPWQTTMSLDGQKPLFRSEGDRFTPPEIHRKHLLEWHQKRYLGRKVITLPFGARWEIVWRLIKLDTTTGGLP